MVSLGQISIVCALATVLCCQVAESVPFGKYFNDAKEYLVSKVKDGVINRIQMGSNFQAVIANVKSRYEEAKNRGELEGKTEDEISAFYYEIVCDEVKKVRQQIEADESQAKGFLDHNAASKLTEGSEDTVVELKSASWMEDDEAEELELLAELNQLQSDEAEMGWSMSPEARAALKKRTQELFHDLMSNEIRQLAMALVTAYFTEGAIGPIMMMMSPSIKAKVSQYLMTCFMDLLAILSGANTASPIGVPGTVPAITQAA